MHLDAQDWLESVTEIREIPHRTYFPGEKISNEYKTEKTDC